MANHQIVNHSKIFTKRKHLILLLITVLTLFLFQPLALAGDSGLAGFNSQMFKPQVDGYGLYNVSGSKVLPHLKYSFGFYANYSKNSLSAIVPARRASIKLIDSNLAGDFNAALGVFNFMDFGVNVPVAFYQNGRNFNTLSKYGTSTVGDIRFDVKFRALKDKPRSVGLAFLSSASFPTGSRYKFTGDRGLAWEGRLVIDKSFKPISLHANVGYRITKAVTILSTNVDDRITFGGGLAFPIPAGDRSWSVLAEVYGETVAKNMTKTTTPIEVRGGVRKKFKSGIALNLGGGGGVTSAMGSPDFRIFAGISFNLADRIKALKKEHVDLNYIVQYGFNKYKVPTKDYSRLREIGQALAKNPDVHIKVAGHTDSIGSKRYNEKLSRKRAEQVKQFLQFSGASEAQIFLKAFGEQQPAAPNNTSAGRRKNRRTELKNMQ